MRRTRGALSQDVVLSLSAGRVEMMSFVDCLVAAGTRRERVTRREHCTPLSGNAAMESELCSQEPHLCDDLYIAKGMIVGSTQDDDDAILGLALTVHAAMLSTCSRALSTAHVVSRY